MSKGTRFLTAAVPAAIVYLLLWLHVLPTPLIAREAADQVLAVVSCCVVSGIRTDAFLLRSNLQTCTVLRLQLPWWLLVSFGSYSLMSLGLGLLRFHDTPEAYESLLREIAQAKNELRDQGVHVD